MAYLPLSTANLPDPVIDPAQGASPEDYFNTVLYTGNGSTQSITGVGFQPDLLWLKERNSTGYPIMQNSISGVQKELYTNVTNAENSVSNGIQSFDSDGWTVGSDGWQNGSGDSMVAWNWKANGSGVTNTDGSITSTVSANTTSGFSIVSYTGNGTAGATVGHGLDSAPEMVITKNRDATQFWIVQHKDLSGITYNLYLQGTDAQQADAQYTAISNTTLTVNGASVNTSGNDYISYCFHSVEGFSKFSSYVGNGSTDGPFVYTGFRPAFVICKKTSAAENWSQSDSARSPFNVAQAGLSPSTSNAENTTNGWRIDLLSNGFKPRDGAGQFNDNGATYIYMAFAENPFKYSNAR